jgi:hypothetical protein
MSLNEQAAARLEETGFIRKIRAQMKAEVMRTLTDMEEEGELPKNLKLKRYEPDDPNANALSYVAQFLRFHGLTATYDCLVSEVDGPIITLRGSESEHSELALVIELYKQKKAAE